MHYYIIILYIEILFIPIILLYHAYSKWKKGRNVINVKKKKKKGNN